MISRPSGIHRFISERAAKMLVSDFTSRLRDRPSFDVCATSPASAPCTCRTPRAHSHPSCSRHGESPTIGRVRRRGRNEVWEVEKRVFLGRPIQGTLSPQANSGPSGDHQELRSTGREGRPDPLVVVIIPAHRRRRKGWINVATEELPGAFVGSWLAPLDGHVEVVADPWRGALAALSIGTSCRSARAYDPRARSDPCSMLRSKPPNSSGVQPSDITRSNIQHCASCTG